MSATDEHVKIFFQLEQDEEGYPPQEWESLWARSTRDGYFELDNIPFFVKGVSMKDVVTVQEVKGDLVFEEVHQYAGHGTIRLLMSDAAEVNAVRDELVALGCSSELSHIPNLIAVDIPPGAEAEKVLHFLQAGEQAGRFEYEEAAVWW